VQCSVLQYIALFHSFAASCRSQHVGLALNMTQQMSRTEHTKKEIVIISLFSLKAALYLFHMQFPLRSCFLPKPLFASTVHICWRICVFWLCSILIISFWIKNWSQLSLFLLLGGNTLQKRLRLRHFKPDWDEMWHHCSSSKYRPIDRVSFLIWHTFKMAAITSFQAEKCCHLVSAHAVSAWHPLHLPATSSYYSSRSIP